MTKTRIRATLALIAGLLTASSALLAQPRPAEQLQADIEATKARKAAELAARVDRVPRERSSPPQAPASTASPAYTRADTTRDTPCGSPGIGIVLTSPITARVIEAREATPGQRVDRNGYWVKCHMPPKGPDCPKTLPEPWRGADGWRLCTPAKLQPLQARDVGATGYVYTPAGTKPAGWQQWACERQADGKTGWVLQRSHCAG